MVGVIWLIVGYGVIGYQVDWFVDALAYRNVDRAMPYEGVLGDPGTFPYSPAAAQFFILLGWIPEPVFLAGWMAMNVAILIWLVRPWPWIALILALPIARELIVGQIELVIAAAIVLGFRRPWLWAVPILTKVSPGVGLVWHAVRREWRELGIALGATAAIVVVSYVAAPAWWTAWLSFLDASTSRAPHQLLLLRLGIAGILVAWAARTDRLWVIPIGVMLALPVVWLHSPAILIACVRLRTPGSRG